ncbi:MAG: hypothetical protein B0D96_13360 [Candidatus Sedimenticola endophacoides]|uniref:Pyruvate dehydrogenase complex repressor n=1 Tax=Candidatus Sedimenticola endophacoides TaxID=2548426 RepID=A0A6N4DZW1_9GAMM|nr:MAG: hypothetical protein B0D94_00500 [Candidatus Sedimenticola endophacoides]OQX32614.1 MAG: hypothetical protein B0D96_13360 [Candidatus Sedimenticola endophacoides]OQX42858.1 MAG: hypothetical protein B0D89_00405 [Candidatus Sedimenticola endophacoides]OQX45815.1 MAG: hypothetical protein B0D86_02835 [Candidatus Sedimenticola endophacoides]PUE00350.1 MAG: transcriptional regulator PdhR [Candidatus Sedimenticola endophacoides]
MSATQKIPDQIASRIEGLIANGNLEPGQRLPSERDLAGRLGVSRPSLREAIRKLNSKGLLTTRRGGGTYVNNPEPGFVDPLLELLRDRPESRFDVLEVRLALEGSAAYHAALRGTGQDKAGIRERFERMMACYSDGDPLEAARADAEFHLSIIEAAHNPVLLHVMRGLFTLLLDSIHHSLDRLYTLPKVSEPLRNQHRRLFEAIDEGDADKARRAAREHLHFVEQSLQQIDRAALREQRRPHGPE